MLWELLTSLASNFKTNLKMKTATFKRFKKATHNNPKILNTREHYNAQSEFCIEYIPINSQLNKESLYFDVCSKRETRFQTYASVKIKISLGSFVLLEETSDMYYIPINYIEKIIANPDKVHLKLIDCLVYFGLANCWSAAGIDLEVLIKTVLEKQILK